jgi:general stress protein 26
MRSEFVDQSYDRVWEIIKDCRFAMLMTVEADGSLRSRPMTTVQKEFSGRLWFFAPTHSDATHAVEQNSNVCVAYANASHADFVSISGEASIVTDAAIKERLWSPMLEAYFPHGAPSPEVSLIKVYATHAEYWDSKSSKLVQLFSMASAYLRGKPPRHLGEHHQVKMT